MFRYIRNPEEEKNKVSEEPKKDINFKIKENPYTYEDVVLLTDEEFLLACFKRELDDFIIPPISFKKESSKMSEDLKINENNEKVENSSDMNESNYSSEDKNKYVKIEKEELKRIYKRSNALPEDFYDKSKKKPAEF